LVKRPFAAAPWFLWRRHRGRPARQINSRTPWIIADPQVLLDNGTYYLYGTGGVKGTKVWTSPDLVNWRDRGAAFRAPASSWGQDRFWAPEVIKTNGKYYLFYSAGGADGVMRICVATANSPLGPFSDVAAPLWDDGKAYIDAHVFIDTNGQAYLYCSQDMSVPADGRSDVVVAKLSPSLTSLASAPALCISPSVAWEGGGNKWNEAPSVIKHGSYYYLLYSGNVYSSPNYSIGYAYSTSPLGPWTKYAGNPIVKKTATVSGPGHCSVTTSPDGQQLWLVYHTQQQLSGGGERQLAVDRIAFVDQPSGPALLTVPGGPSTAMQTEPSGAPDFPTGGTDEFNTSSINRGRWVIFNENSANHNPTGSVLEISTVDGDVYEDTRANEQNIFLQYPPSQDFEVTAKINFSPGQNFEQVSLFAWQDHNNYLRFSQAWINGKKYEIGLEQNASFTAQQAANSLGSNFYLRLNKQGTTYRCYGSSNGSSWSAIGQPVTANFSDLKIGLAAASPNSGRKLTAAFDYFRVEPLASGVTDWSVY